MFAVTRFVQPLLPRVSLVRRAAFTGLRALSSQTGITMPSVSSPRASRIATRPLSTSIAAASSSTSSSSDAPFQGPTPKTSMMFTLSNTPGSLQKVLSFFWKHDINLTRLESKPVTRGTDYKFFVVFDGYPSDPNAQKLLKDLDESKACTSVQLVDPTVGTSLV